MGDNSELRTELVERMLVEAINTRRDFFSLLKKKIISISSFILFVMRQHPRRLFGFQFQKFDSSIEKTRSPHQVTDDEADDTRV